MVEHALKYAGRGMPVFPVHPNGKAPVGQLVPNGVKNATTDPQTIRDWWHGVPSANIGYATGSVFVVDLDVKGGVDGTETWEEVSSEEGGAPETTTVVTPSGGLHLYYRAPDGVQIKNSVSDAIGPGVDVRGHGGYVLVPPSSIDGNPYEFERRGQHVANAPFWLLTRVRRKEREADASEPKGVTKADEQIGEGERNAKLTSLAGYFRRKGLNEDELRRILLALNESRCSPPLPEGEVEKIAASVANYPATDAAVLTLRNGQENGHGADPQKFSKEQREIARRLLAVLYEVPAHGPVVSAALPPPDGLPKGYRRVYAAMADLGIGKGDLDKARLDARLEGSDALRDVKNPPGFSPGAYREKDPAALVRWADALRNAYVNARIARDLKEMAGELSASDEDPSMAVGKVVERVRSHTGDATAGMTPIAEAADAAMERVDEWEAGKASDYMRTWPSVDDKIEGFANGQLAVMGGFTSGFKTAALVDLVRRIALRHEGEDVYIPIFSAEMNAEQLTHRAAANLSQISPSALRPNRKGEVTATAEEFKAYRGALRRLRGMNIEIDEHPNPSYDRMLGHCLQLEARGRLAFVGFDYLEKMDEEGNTEELRVSQIAQRLKALAKRLGVPVVVLSQYSRQHNGHTQLPQNHYLRYSGKIEQEAQTIIHWFYPRYFVVRGADPGSVAKYDPGDESGLYAVCGKNRDGAIDSVKLWVHEETGRFVDRYDNEPRPTSGAEKPDPLTSAEFTPDETVPF